ncbi:hypothetical protein F4775DRAFT_201803 [Biscogniauxia sp. FL1348]|nr:hypothetical protein F4775DRAFT_201803 [Biscogniauxia sp. FL1348]
MDGTPNFFNCGIQEDNDDDYGFFDSHTAASQGLFHHQAPTHGAYNGDFPLDPPSPPGQPLGSFSMAHVPSRTSISHSRGHNPSRDKLRPPATPHLNSAQLESPVLSSGSASTPETRVSQQLITPEHHPSEPARRPGDFAERLDYSLPNPSSGRRRSRKQKPREEMDPEVEGVKRNRFLERNRVAATKCRQKKKEWVSDLEGAKLTLESQNSHLQMEYNGLIDEVSRIRSELMIHANCHDTNINKWIENEAKRFVLGTGERYDQMLANFGPPSDLDTRHGSMSSMSGYQVTSPDLLSPSTTTSQRGSISLSHNGMVPASPIFYRASIPPSTPGRIQVPTEHGFHHVDSRPTPTADDGTDFDGMPMMNGAFQDPPIR